MAQQPDEPPAVNHSPELRQQAFLLRALIFRQLKRQNSQTVLGMLWVLIRPLSRVLIYFFVFGILFQSAAGVIPEGNRFSWFFSGILPWLFFAEVFGGAHRGLAEYGQLIKRSYFPAQISILVTYGAALINHLLILALYLLIQLAVFRLPLSFNVLWLIPTLIVLSIFVIGLGQLAAAISTLVPDLASFITVFLPLFFFLTPIIYPASRIPDAYALLYQANPLYYFVEFYRYSFFGGSFSLFPQFAWLLLVSVLLMVSGRYVFRRLQPYFPELM
jgi:ABC-type polysaccharide/polyol phosphate export permease